MRMVVDLPAPFGPRKPKISPRCTENEIPATALNAPNRFSRFCTSTTASREITVPSGILFEQYVTYDVTL